MKASQKWLKRDSGRLTPKWPKRDPFNSLCGYSLCAFFAPYKRKAVNYVSVFPLAPQGLEAPAGSWWEEGTANSSAEPMELLNSFLGPNGPKKQNAIVKAGLDAAKSFV